MAGPICVALPAPTISSAIEDDPPLQKASGTRRIILSLGYGNFWQRVAVTLFARLDRLRPGSAQHLLILLDKEVSHGDVTDLVHGETEV